MFRTVVRAGEYSPLPSDRYHLVWVKMQHETPSPWPVVGHEYL